MSMGSDEGDVEQSRRDAEEDDLQDGLGSLAGLVSGAFTLPALLAEVASFATQAIPNADGAGVTLLVADRDDQRIQHRSSSAQFVDAIDDVQYGIVHEGPCLTAAAERRTVRSGDLGKDGMWPRFALSVQRLGIHSALSLPLLLQEKVVGAINVYSRTRDAFDDNAMRIGEAFAVPAAVAVHNAQVLDQARALAVQFNAALVNRAVIDQAIGILRARTGASPEEAFDRLRTISQNQHIKLSAVAQGVVEEAVRRARARTQPS